MALVTRPSIYLDFTDRAGVPPLFTNTFFIPRDDLEPELTILAALFKP